MRLLVLAGSVMGRLRRAELIAEPDRLAHCDQDRGLG
jgi:hypothetical protein